MPEPTTRATAPRSISPAGPCRRARTPAAAARSIIDSGDHHWQASAEGNGAIDALYRAVDKAISEVLDGHPRLLAYDIHALGEGTDTIGVVTVRIAPPRRRGRARRGRVRGRGARPEHHRRVDRGVHRRAQRDARRGALGGRAGGGRGDRQAGAAQVAGVGRGGPRAPRRARRGGRRDRHADWFNRQGRATRSELDVGGAGLVRDGRHARVTRQVR